MNIKVLRNESRTNCAKNVPRTVRDEIAKKDESANTN